jgi:hypothetical protein
MPKVSYYTLGCRVNLAVCGNLTLQVPEYRIEMLNIQYQDVESQVKILQVFIQVLQRLASWSAWLKNKFFLIVHYLV